MENKSNKIKRNLYLMLPMFNEQESITKLLSAVDKVRSRLQDPLEVVIVDDGSSDDSIKKVEAFGKKTEFMNIKIIPHEKNMGLGQAMRTGIYHLAETVGAEDIVFTMDADNTHDPKYMIDMKKKIDQGNEIVIASRYCSGGDEWGLKIHRKILSFGASGLLSSVFKCKNIKDYTCGYRAYKGRLLKEAYDHYKNNLIRENGFTCMAELLIKTHQFAKGAGEIPMILRYDLKGGASKMKILKTVYRYVHLIKNLKRELLSADSCSQDKETVKVV